MNQSLQYSIDFPAAIWYNSELQLNTYSVNLQLTTVQERPVITGVALERIKAFVLSELANVVFINSEYDSVAELLDAIGANVCTLPHEPHDQIVGLMLLCKLTAIVEGNLEIAQLDISSSLGDEIWYQLSNEDALGPFAGDGWWHNRSCQHSVLVTEPTDNVVKVDTQSWQDYGLEWPELETGKQATIVKPDFRRHETNQTR